MKKNPYILTLKFECFPRSVHRTTDDVCNSSSTLTVLDNNFQKLSIKSEYAIQ